MAKGNWKRQSKRLWKGKMELIDILFIKIMEIRRNGKFICGIYGCCILFTFVGYMMAMRMFYDSYDVSLSSCFLLINE